MQIVSFLLLIQASVYVLAGPDTFLSLNMEVNNINPTGKVLCKIEEVGVTTKPIVTGKASVINQKAKFQSIRMKFEFNKEQNIKVSVYEADKAGDKDTPVCFFQTTMGDLVAGKGGQVTLQSIKHSDENTSMTIAVEDIGKTVKLLALEISGKELTGTGEEGFKCTMTISKKNEQGKWQRIYLTEPIKDPNPTWKTVKIPVTLLPKDSSVLRFKIFRFWKNITEVVGTYESTMKEINAGSGNKGRGTTFYLGGKDSKEGPAILIKQSAAATRESFVECVKNHNLRIDMPLGIDLTISNGDPQTPDSLHCRGEENQYTQTILELSAVLFHYDDDKKYPVYGFGGKQKGIVGGRVNHFFNLNGKSTPTCDGIDAIMKAYDGAFEIFELWKPTNLEPLIKGVCDSIRLELKQSKTDEGSEECGQKYYFLIVLTDGEVLDMDGTKTQIIKAAQENLPLSIIFVGITSPTRNASFESLVILDGDDAPLTNDDGEVTPRDIANFIASKGYLWPDLVKKTYGGDRKKAAKAFVAGMLEEGPEQIESFLAA